MADLAGSIFGIGNPLLDIMVDATDADFTAYDKENSRQTCGASSGIPACDTLTFPALSSRKSSLSSSEIDMVTIGGH